VTSRARLRFWLLALDAAELLRLPLSLRSWALRRAAAAVDYRDEPPENPDPARRPW
jgi:hypothetical protein